MKTFDFDTKKAHKLRIRGENGVILQGEQVQSLTLTSCCCSDGGIGIGNVCSAQLRGVVTGAAELLDEVIRAECVFTENGTEKVLPLGCFRVTEWLRTEDTAELTAYDALYWGTGVGYLPDCGENPKVNEVLADLARQMGVELEAQSGLGEMIRVSGDLSGHSIREMIGWMAALAGGNAVLTREGRLKVVWFSEGAAFSQEEAYSGGLTTKGKLFLAGMQVRVPVKSDGEEETEGETVLSVGAGNGFVMELENPYFNEEILGQVWQEISAFNEAAALLTEVTDGMASLGSLSVLGGLETETGDLVTMTGKNGEKTVLPAMSVVLELDGGSRCTVSAMGQGAAETGAVFQGTMGRLMTRVQAEIAEFKRLTVKDENGETKIYGGNIESGTIKGVNLEGENLTIHVKRTTEYEDGGIQPHETTMSFDENGVSVSVYHGGVRDSGFAFRYGELSLYNAVVSADDFFSNEEWRPIELAQGVTAYSSNFGSSPLGVPAYRVVGGMCYITGTVSVTAVSSGTVNIGSMWSSTAWPKANVYQMAACQGNRLARILVNARGNILLDWLVNISDASRHTGNLWLQLNMCYPVAG